MDGTLPGAGGVKPVLDFAVSIYPEWVCRSVLSRYSQEIIEQVRAANDIVDVVGGVVELKPSGGGRMVGLCPFHQDSAPSFYANRDRQNFFCFGCEAHGDVFGFLMQHEGLTFVEALRRLADRGRVHLPAPTEREGREDMLRARMLELGAWACKRYMEALNSPMAGASAKKYLESRALDPRTAEKFGVGYAPDEWQFLVDAGRKDKYGEELLRQSGLVKKSERGRVYDLFRDRLMFPIRNPNGDVVAFGGRDLSGNAPGKYINSPENAVYKKNRTLYGVFEAKDALRKEKRALLVEGYFDVLRCHDAGLHNAVATCGTALTLQQANVLRRYVREVVVLFDGDSAGIKAALKGVAVLVAADLTVRAVALPGGRDPDDFVRDEGAEALRKLVDDAENFVSFYVRSSEDRLTSIEGKTEVAQELFGIIRGIEGEIRRTEYLKLVAAELGIDQWTVRREFEQGRDSGDVQPRESERDESKSDRPSHDDLNFVAALLHSPRLVDVVRDGLHGVSISKTPLAIVLRAVLDGARPEQIAPDSDAELLYDAASNVDPDELKEPEVLVDRRVRRMKRDALEQRRKALQERLFAASRPHAPADQGEATALLAEKISIEREIEAIGAV